MAKLRPQPEEGQQIDPSIDSPTLQPDRFRHRRARRSSTETSGGARAKQQRRAARHPRKRPRIEAIFAERGIVLATLAGIPKRDRADVEQAVFIGAWRAIRNGRYRPNPKDDPRDALRKWLHGIAWRQAAKYLDSAYVRRFILDPQPLGRLRGVVGPDLHAQVEARDLLRTLDELPERHREILLAVDNPESLSAYARQRGMNPFTAASRLRIAREALALRLRRRR